MAESHKLKNLSVHEVSFVDYPANQHAKIKLTKRDDTQQKRDYTEDERQAMADRKEALPDGSFPIADKTDLENAIRSYGRAKDKAKAKAHIRTRARALGAEDMLPDSWDSESKIDDILSAIKGLFGNKSVEKLDLDDGAVSFDQTMACQGLYEPMWRANSALQASIESIIQDTSGKDKSALLKESCDEFTTYVQQLVANVITKANPSAQEIAKMSFAVKKSLGLGADASEAEVQAKFAELQKAAALGKLTRKQKRYAKAMLNGEDLLKFAQLSPAEKVAIMKAKPKAKDDEDEEDEMDDEDDEEEEGDSEADKKRKAKMRKAKRDAMKKPKEEDDEDEGAETPEGQKKARLRALAKSNPEVAELLRKSAIDEIEKRVNTGLQHIGKSRDTAEMLYELHAKAGKALAEKVETALKRASNLITKGQVFKEFGSDMGDTGDATAAEQLKALGQQIMKRDNLKGDGGRAVAMTKARAENPELAERERSERQSA